MNHDLQNIKKLQLSEWTTKDEGTSNCYVLTLYSLTSFGPPRNPKVSDTIPILQLRESKAKGEALPGKHT